MKKQKIAVFQQNGSGESKIKGISKYGKDFFDLQKISLDMPLPAVIEDAAEYLPDKIDADIVLDYLKHPDISYDLAKICAELNIPVVASGKKIKAAGVISPPTCCGLPLNEKLGKYGQMFGSPEFEVELKNGKLSDIKVIRGAPCGATWEAAERIRGLEPEEAVQRMGLDTQYFCTANPAGWDPIYGKSPVHFAGNVHSAGLKKAFSI